MNITEVPGSDLSLQDRLLNDSRLSPNGNGDPNNRTCSPQRPSNIQKWWAAIIIGCIFGLISSPAAYAVTSRSVGLPPMAGARPTPLALFVQSLIFILVIRIVLW